MDFQTRYIFNPQADFLGKGGFSRVYRATDTLLERTVALKFFTSDVSEKYQVLNEIKKVIRCEHPNLCKYYDVALLSSTNMIGELERTEVGIMEYLDSGDFKHFVRDNPSFIDKLFVDILKGLSYLHKKGIVHRDLKPQNILIQMSDGEPVAKITDFGISKVVDGENSNNDSSALMGTIEYMAPEQFNPKKYGINGRIATNLDLWSYGLMVYETIMQESMFGSRSSGISAEQVMSNILSNTTLEKIENLPERYKQVVARCLVKEASERAQVADELIEIFEGKNADQKIKIHKDENDETRVIQRPVIHEEKNEETLVLDKGFFQQRAYFVETGSQENLVTSSILRSDAGQRRKKLMRLGLFVLLPLFLGISVFLIYRYSANGKVGNLAATSQKVGSGVTVKDVNSKPLTMPTSATELRDCAHAGNVNCAYEIGMIYYEGKKESKDLEKAFYYFELASKKDEPRAQCMLGNMYFMGIGVKKDYAKALPLYKKSADNGNTVAMYALGLAYINGGGVKQSSSEAKKWFQQVVEKSDNTDAITAAKQQLESLR